MGEADGSRWGRIRAIAGALIASGLKAPVTVNLRTEIWVKLLGNVAFNPLSALTGATLVQMARHPEGSNLVRSIMQETQTLAGTLGIEMPISTGQRIAGADKRRRPKNSRLPDFRDRPPPRRR